MCLPSRTRTCTGHGSPKEGACVSCSCIGRPCQSQQSAVQDFFNIANNKSPALRGGDFPPSFPPSLTCARWLGQIEAHAQPRAILTVHTAAVAMPRKRGDDLSAYYCRLCAHVRCSPLYPTDPPTRQQMPARKINGALHCLSQGVAWTRFPSPGLAIDHTRGASCPRAFTAVQIEPILEQHTLNLGRPHRDHQPKTSHDLARLHINTNTLREHHTAAHTPFWFLRTERSSRPPASFSWVLAEKGSSA